MGQLIAHARSASDESTLQKMYIDIWMTVVQYLPITDLLFMPSMMFSTRSIDALTALSAYDNFNGFKFLMK